MNKINHFYQRITAIFEIAINIKAGGHLSIIINKKADVHLTQSCKSLSDRKAALKSTNKTKKYKK